MKSNSGNGDDDMGTEIINLEEKREEQQRKVARRVARRRSVQGESITRLRSLNCFENVDEMVREGVFAREVAEYIQDIAGEYNDVSLEAVTRAVRRYRDSLGEAGVQAAIDSGVGGDIDDDDPLYELRVMQQMFEEQRQRIVMEIGTERNLRKLFSTTHKEFEALQHLGREILTQKKRLGMIGREAERRQRREKSRGLPGRLKYSEIVRNPESRQKVLSVIETLFGDRELMDDIISRGGIKKPVDEGTGASSKPNRRRRRRRNKSKKGSKASNDSNDSGRQTSVTEDD